MTNLDSKMEDFHSISLELIKFPIRNSEFRIENAIFIEKSGIGQVQKRPISNDGHSCIFFGFTSVSK